MEKLGAAPLAKDLGEIRAADTRAKLAALMGRAPDGYFGAFFSLSEQPDAKTPTRYAIYIGQEGLGLPDRDYYLKPSFAPQKAKYQAYVAQMLTLAGWPDPEAQAAAVVALETRIAEASWTKVEERDPVKSYNPMSTAELAALAPGFPWKAFLDSADLGGLTTVVVSEKSAFPKIAAIFADTPISTLQAWQAFTVTRLRGAVPVARFRRRPFQFPRQDTGRSGRAEAALEAGRLDHRCGVSVRRWAASMSPNISLQRPRPRWKRWSAT